MCREPADLSIPGRSELLRDLVLRACFSALIAIALLSGCASRRFAVGPETVSHELAHRMRYSLAPAGCNGGNELPYGASLKDGLDEDEAIVLALWRDAAFHEMLAEFGIARSDLIQAGMLPNPEFTYLFQAPGKPLRYALDLPLEAFLLRPLRIAAANRESERVAHRVTQGGLDLIRDVRQAFAELHLVHMRLRVTDEGVQIRSRISELAEARLRAGDISVQEAAAARLDALQARQDRIRAAHDVPVAEERLRHLLSLGERSSLKLNPTRLMV